MRRASAAQRAGLAGRLAENLDRQEQALLGGDVNAFAVLAMQFHRACVEASGNSAMPAIYDRLRDRQYLSIIGSAGRISSDPQQVITEHRALLEHRVGATGPQSPPTSISTSPAATGCRGRGEPGRRGFGRRSGHGGRGTG